jgi:hypothetical protein
MMQHNHAPELPEPISITDDQTRDLADENSGLTLNRINPNLATVNSGISLNPALEFRHPWVLRSLKHGCYFLQWKPANTFWYRLNGTMRVERHGSGVTASGDLYNHNAFTFTTWPSFRWIPNNDPNPSAGIPIFRRANYRYYLRVTQILEYFTTSGSFTMKFERRQFNASNNTWTNNGTYEALMTFKNPPAGYPSGAIYLEGTVKNPSGVADGTISMGWVSPYLRKATLEIDRVSASDAPTDNGGGLDWRDVYDAVDWDVTVDWSDSNLTEPSGQSWSDAECHAAMISRRDSSDLDTEWRYHLLCVRRLDSTSRGIMYDAYGGDSNNIPREGAALASHWTIPDTSTWGTVRGQRFGAADAPYFRTAVHEIGHAMGLYHNTADNGFMNTTGTIAASPGTFPANVQWSFNAADQKRLRHMPDPWVRPGMIPFGNQYTTAPISPTDMMDLAGVLSLKVEPLLETVPLGAPVRVRLTLTNETETVMDVPASLSLKSEHTTGRVVDVAGQARTFRSLIKCLEEHHHETLKPGQSMTADMTLLRGSEGALFPIAGMHRIEVDVAWESGGIPVKVSGAAPVMVTPPVDDEHSQAAMKVLASADLLLTLAIGGDHLEDGVDALQTAMANKTLAPHFAVVEAKRLGRHFGKRRGDLKKAAATITAEAIMSASEIKSIAKIIKDTPAPNLKKAGKKVVAALKESVSEEPGLKALLEKITD